MHLSNLYNFNDNKCILTHSTRTQHDTFVAYCITFFNGSSYHDYYELYMYVYMAGIYIMSGSSSGSGSRRRGSSRHIGESSGEPPARPLVYLQPKADET